MLLSACGIVEMLASVAGSSNEITLGTGNLDYGVLDEKYRFSQYEDIMMDIYMDEPFGTSEISFVIVKKEGSSELMHMQWYETVDPSWDWMTYEFYLVNYDGVLDPGEYMVRVFKNDSDLIAERRFSIE